MLTSKQRIIFFDVVETLFSLDPLEARLVELNLPAGTGRLFFTQLLRDAFALTASGKFHPFPNIAKGTLNVLLDSLGYHHDDAITKDVLGIFAKLPAHDDVKPALEKLRQAACEVILLTNGSRANTEILVRNSGIDYLVDDIVSVEDFKLWKPQKDLYRQAALKYDCPPENALLVAAHAWDIHGAMAAGFKGIWVRRQELIYHPLMGKPDGQVSDLVEGVDLALNLIH